VTGGVPVPVPAPRPLYLHDPAVGEPFLGIYHGLGEAPCDTAVLFCPPFGYDDVCAYRGLRAWALELAAGGIAALRIDLPGTGDSAGGPRDPGRAASWPRAVAAAAAWLRAETGARRVVAVGVGLGGLIAGQAVADGAPVDDLVLWGAPSRGRALVRELRAFARLGVSKVDDFAFDPQTMPPLPEGALESGGFLLSPETVAWLKALDLAAAPLPDAARRHVLLLGREGISVDARLEQALTAAGADVAAADGPGYTELMDEPHRSQPPTATFAVVAEWLARTAGGEHSAPAAATSPSAGTTVTATEAIDVTAGDAIVRETPIAIAALAEGGSLFGIVAGPSGPGTPDAAAPLCAVFLNVGAERRIGANRMWVEASRRWAARGVPSVRLDFVGIGEGGGPATPWGEKYGLYRAELVDQVATALDALQARGLPPRFLLIGMCSGAYWSFSQALRDPRVVALELLNTRMLLFDETRGSAAEVRHLRRLGTAQTWRDVLGGRLTRDRVRRMGRAVAVMVARMPQLAARRLRAAATGGDPLDRALDTLRDRGTALSLCFSAGEPLRDDLERTGHLGRLARWPNVSVRPLPGPEDAHTLQVVRMQPAVHRELDAFLEEQLARLDGEHATAAPIRSSVGV
jgi:hypothetical protein